MAPWASDTVSYTYQNRLRTALSLPAPNASPWTQTYGYDTARRLTNVTSSAGAFTYLLGARGGASPLIKKLLLPNGAYITNFYDGNARLLGTYLRNSGNTNLDTYDYAYNVGNQRTQQVFTAGNFDSYTYDNIGQLKTAYGKESGAVTNRLQEQLGYVYDAAGNLNYRTNNTLLQQFNVNNLNELTVVSNAGNLTVAGTTTSPATVTVNGSSATLYLDATFTSANQSWANGNNSYTAIAQDSYGRKDTNSITVDIESSNSVAYDLNGNLRTNGTRVFEYDDENQLARITQSNAWKSEFTYDGKMRRRTQTNFTWNGSSWLPTNGIHYVYDGNLVIQERDGGNLPQVTYTRGNDMSGSLQGAGGIGGLLARTDAGMAIGGSKFATACYHADGNGNITCLIYTNQTIAAKYEYDPYGNILSKNGSLAEGNVYRFSSKEYQSVSGVIYYLCRYYDPNMQRWLSRDPISELGGINLHNYVVNNPVNYIDPFGLVWVLDSEKLDPQLSRVEYKYDFTVSASWFSKINGVCYLVKQRIDFYKTIQMNVYSQVWIDKSTYWKPQAAELAKWGATTGGLSLKETPWSFPLAVNAFVDDALAVGIDALGLSEEPTASKIRTEEVDLGDKAKYFPASYTKVADCNCK